MCCFISSSICFTGHRSKKESCRISSERKRFPKQKKLPKFYGYGIINEGIVKTFQAVGAVCCSIRRVRVTVNEKENTLDRVDALNDLFTDCLWQ